MQGSGNLKRQKLKPKEYMKAFCCSCRLSVSLCDEGEGANLDRSMKISSIAHTMVQEKLDHMIKERTESRHEERKNSRSEGTKFVVMVATEKSSYDPREDFKESVVEMITTNRIYEPKDQRSLLNYYVSMNKEEYRGVILEVFYEVCTYMFLNCKYYS